MQHQQSFFFPQSKTITTLDRKDVTTQRCTSRYLQGSNTYPYKRGRRSARHFCIVGVIFMVFFMFFGTGKCHSSHQLPSLLLSPSLAVYRYCFRHISQWDRCYWTQTHVGLHIFHSPYYMRLSLPAFLNPYVMVLMNGDYLKQSSFFFRDSVHASLLYIFICLCLCDRMVCSSITHARRGGSTRAVDTNTFLTLAEMHPNIIFCM